MTGVRLRLVRQVQLGPLLSRVVATRPLLLLLERSRLTRRW